MKKTYLTKSDYKPPSFQLSNLKCSVIHLFQLLDYMLKQNRKPHKGSKGREYFHITNIGKKYFHTRLVRTFALQLSSPFPKTTLHCPSPCKDSPIFHSEFCAKNNTCSFHFFFSFVPGIMITNLYYFIQYLEVTVFFHQGFSGTDTLQLK